MKNYQYIGEHRTSFYIDGKEYVLIPGKEYLLPEGNSHVASRVETGTLVEISANKKQAKKD